MGVHVVLWEFGVSLNLFSYSFLQHGVRSCVVWHAFDSQMLHEHYTHI